MLVYARVTVVEGSPDKIEQGIDSFQNAVLPAAKSVVGYRQRSFLPIARLAGVWELPCGKAKRPVAEERKPRRSTRGNYQGHGRERFPRRGVRGRRFRFVGRLTFPRLTASLT